MKALICVFLGGGVGSALRYYIQTWINRGGGSEFPWATLVVNVLGSFLIGLFYALSERFNISHETRLLLTMGFCGGFTTFSTFSVEGLNLLKEQLYGVFSLYLLLSVVLGIVGVFLGIWLVRNVT